ncbi:hypothetical protein CHGG_02090 [Chaetomium globosum CBS 148.51]|uniref:Uncharacterized protein n=1 Tax=Chaetomium globosum (strain ATCC 6205 / CBS 148.51 / DSM 1962 / NBRC 6347 / NRRL 1970) TaxID=306901 RepID=Q2HCG4_CHAGB|nr:uncharacterized protein CHGG_02090 [Chaetomium globosum CBS 148.51]EAQ93855.1 hypothetical protein CHGG_02090 [Chaetomium globosum CBS 148.51]
MDRGRSSIPRGRGAKKRATLPSHSHSHSYSSHQSLSFSDTAPPTTPEPSNILPSNRVPYTTPQRGGRTGARQANNNTQTTYRASSPATEQADRADRPVRSSTFPFFSFADESPPAAGSIMAAHGPARKRSRTFETPYEGAADDEGHSKGGHSLRKRARIDYTQEMIDDDLGLPAAKNDLVVKPAATPGARSRKRKGGHDDSGDESEDVASNLNKRHRIDKSPVPPRMPVARRRNPSKKLSTDLSPFVDQPSDNEVQDTILVSVPNTGPDAPSEASDHSSSQDPESRPTSSGESVAARVQVQPPTPPAPPSQPVEDAMSITAEGDQVIDNIIPGQPYDEPQPQFPPSHLSLMPDGDVEKAESTFKNEAKASDDVVSVVMQDSEAGLPGALETQIDEAGHTEQSPSQQPHQQDGMPPQTLTTQLETPKPVRALAPESGLPFTAPQTLHGVTSGSLVSHTAPFPDPKPTGPARFKALEPVYGAEVPFASHLKLTPYEEEDIPLPGPYTEWVHPVQTIKGELKAEPKAELKAEPKGEPTPFPTPTPVFPSLERKSVGIEWETSRPLKYKEFMVLYRKETRRRQEKGEPPISIREFNNECARRYKSAHTQASPSATPTPTTESTASSTVVARTPALITAASVEEVVSRDSQPVESRPPTAAPSPAPFDDGMGQDDVPEDEQDADELMDDQVKASSPGEPVEVTRNPHTQYLFPKIRDCNDFVEAFEGWQDFPNERLYETVAAAVETLHTYQQEYNELKKLLDDEDNAKRRKAHDKTVINWENRQKADEPLPPRRHFDDPVKGPAPFEVRGIRAPRPYIDDPLLEQQKEEDRVMAQAYGFKLNTHPTQVGRQNPEEQRWEMPENRLRKRTEKGAELAEENVVEGKRTRKPRHVSDQSKDPSRAGTPTGITVLGPGRRQRRKPTTAGNGDEYEGRAGRARAAVLLDDRDQITPVAGADGNRTEDEEREVEEKPKATRRRGRGAPSFPEPPTSVPAGFGGETSKPKRARGTKSLQPNQQAGGEVASSSFYSNASTQPDSRPSTSSSNGTAHTAETTESTYSLREKRKRNFVLENDPELETRPQRRGRGTTGQKANGAATEPKKRGPRKKEPAAQAPPPPPSVPSPSPRPATPPPLQPPVATKFYHNFVTGPMVVDAGNGSQPAATQAGPYLHTFNAAPAFVAGTHPPPPPPPLVKKPITKIKLTNHGASSSAPSRASTPSNGAPSSKPKRPRGKKAAAASEAQLGLSANGDGDLDKPYAEMTKSEKMSWSMRRRWASGEMQGAVEKRRTTLANKKAEKAATNPNADGGDANGMGQMTDSGSAGPSDPTTPASMHGQPGSGLLALPQGPPMMLQHPPPHQGFLQQPSYLYAMPHGPPPGPPGPMS